ncbi:hypothetical protein I7I53_00141 [Histoplasma capsulatum var. duboisii H88]|uniref:Uncharacterized protein n=1 Tax=Ajellomyces capsulatus (strain H88) TaxID=544711 RepID=A0A8A1LG24_AJEC8|nr:hypothetical protein I7I53_00141 [Histoplasma capsulatum var. duboisii H88]
MAAKMQIYCVRNRNPSTIPRTGLQLNEAHVFLWGDNLFVVSDKEPKFDVIQNISSGYSCDDESLVQAAVFARGAPQAVREAYLEVIRNRNLAKKFGVICEQRDGVTIEYQKSMKAEWQNFAKALDEIYQRLLKSTQQKEVAGCLHRLENYLRTLKNRIGDMIGWYSNPWTLDFLLLALADCTGKMDIMLWSFQRALETETLYELPTLSKGVASIKEQCQRAVRELDDKIADARASHDAEGAILNKRPTVYQILLHISLILLDSHPPIIANRLKKDLNILSWKPFDWETRCLECDGLSNDDFAGLALALADFTPFTDIELTGGKIKRQYTAMMAEFRRISGEMATGASKSDEFSAPANMMIVCTCLGVHMVAPQLEDLDRPDIESHTSGLNVSPLYPWGVTLEDAAGQFDIITLSLTPERDLVKPSSERRAEDGPHNQLVVARKIVKRSSDGDLRDGKRRKGE